MVAVDCLQVQRGEGTIINTGSMSGVRPTPSQCVYSSCKWGLPGWSLGCQEALRHHGVKVMLINPGAAETSSNRANGVAETLSAQCAENVLPHHGLQAMLEILER